MTRSEVLSCISDVEYHPIFFISKDVNAMQQMERAMTASEDRLRVFYDGACPSCVRDRKFCGSEAKKFFPSVSEPHVV